MKKRTNLAQDEILNDALYYAAWYNQFTTPVYNTIVAGTDYPLESMEHLPLWIREWLDYAETP